MYYEINIALNGRHFFATADHSLTYIGEVNKVLPVILEKFPKSEGYDISVTLWRQRGEILDIQDIIDNI